MKIAVGTTMNAIGCHHCRETNSSGSPTAVRQASAAPFSLSSAEIHSRKGRELRLTFLKPAASASSTAPHENSTSAWSCESDIRWYSEKIPTVPSAIKSAETSSQPR